MTRSQIYAVDEISMSADTCATSSKVAGIEYMSMADCHRRRGIGWVSYRVAS